MHDLVRDIFAEAPFPDELEGLRNRTECTSVHSHTALNSHLVPIDDWDRELPWLLDALINPSETTSHDNSVPFSALLAPIVACATARALDSRYTEPSFDTSAISDLTSILLKRLSDAASPSLLEHFGLFRAARIAGRISAPQAHDSIFSDYILFFRRVGAHQFFTSRPLLARLLTVLTIQWMQWAPEFVRRYVSDKKELARQFLCTDDLGKVLRIEGHISDPHNKGQTVLILHFQGGRRLVYKPRGLSPEKVWNQLLHWLNVSWKDRLTVLRVVDRCSYGWMEFAQSNNIDSRQYYLAAGNLLFLLYLFGIDDMHTENVVVGARGPVIVDLETMMQMSLPLHEARRAFASEKLSKRISQSVLRAGFLPTWAESPRGDALAIGGLNHSARRGYIDWRIVEPNTDRMRRALVDFGTEHLDTASPTFTHLTCAQKANYVARGFGELYSWFKANRATLFDTNSPITKAFTVTTRYVARPTQFYALVLSRVLTLPALANPKRWAEATAALDRLSVRSDSPAVLRELISYEKRSLRNMDVPLFQVRATSTDVLVDGAAIARTDYRSGADELTRRVRLLSDSDRRWQQWLISAAFALEEGQDHLNGEHVALTFPETAAPHLNIDNKRWLIDEAERLGMIISNSTFRRAGSATWIGIAPLSGHTAGQISECGPGLYAGTVGIGLFLAALFRFTNNPHYRDLALLAARGAMVEVLGNDQATGYCSRQGIGSGSGIASVAFGMALIGQLGQCADLVEAGVSLAKCITLPLVANDTKYDVLGGSAGAILSLLALNRIIQDRTLVDTATLCGLHLCSKRLHLGKGSGWPSVFGRPLTGLAHGTAGIAMALYRLYDVTSNETFLHVAREALEFERETYSPKDGGWVDQRFGQRSDLAQWCHGAAGIGLSRLGIPLRFRDQPTRVETQVALHATTSRLGAGPDDLCCGDFGRIEFLLSAALEGVGHGSFEHAYRTAFAIVQRASRLGYRLRGGRLDLNPALFTGVAGIGYSLLRLSNPRWLPNVLLWEASAAENTVV